MNTLNSFAGLTAFNPATSSEVYVAGYYVPGDMGGGEFYYYGSSTATVNNGTVFNSAYGGRWLRVLNGTRVSARWFGATGDGITDDTVALQAAIDYCGANKIGLYLPGGTYIVSSPNVSTACLLIHDNGFFMEGDGYDSEIKLANATPNFSLILLQAYSGQIKNVTVKNIRLNGNKANQNNGVVNWYNKCITVYCLTTSSTDKMDIILDCLHCHDAYSFDPDHYEGGGISISGDDFGFTMQQFPALNILIVNCYCWNNGGWGIGTNWANTVTIANNMCWNNDTMGIALWNSQDIVVNSNNCYNNGTSGINVEISDRVVVSNNTSKSGLLSAIKFFNSIDSIIIGNNCELNASFYLYACLIMQSGDGAYSPGYKVRPCSNILVSGNILRSVGSDGYVMSIINGAYSQNENINIKGNTIINTTTSKAMEVYCTDVTINDNKIIGNLYIDSAGGFVIMGSNDILFDNSPGGFNMVTMGNASSFLANNNTFRSNQNGVYVIALTQPIANQDVVYNAWKGAFAAFVGLYGSATYPAGMATTINW